MMQLVLHVVFLLGFSSCTWGCAGVLSDSSVSENAGEMLVCATFTEPTNSGGSLQLVTSYIGSAKSPNDYVEVSGVFAIPANYDSDLCVNITIIPDNIFEIDEVFMVVLSSEDISLCASSFVFVTIVDDTWLRVSFAQLEYSIVGEVGTVDVCINVSTEGLVFDRPVVYSLVIIPGTADAMIDFIFMESQAQIDSVSDGEALICSTVTIVSDAAFPVVERDEYFGITLSSEDNIVLEGGSARVTIMDNDGATVSLISPSTCISEGDMGVTNATLCVGLDSSFTLERDVELLLNTASVTATPVDDYEELVDASLTIPAGSSPPFQVCRTVAVVGDTVRENDEMFTAEVSAVDDRDMVSDPAVFQVTLKDDVSLLFSNSISGGYIVRESDGILTICVRAEGDSVREFNATLAFQTSTSATAGEDFLVESQVLLSYSPFGERTECADVVILEDSIFEYEEIFSVTLSTTDTDVSIPAPLASVVIVDSTMLTVSFVQPEYSSDEGEVLDVCISVPSDFTFERSRPAVFTFEVIPGTAEIDDFIFSTQLTTIDTDDLGGLVCDQVQILDDFGFVTIEREEYFDVTIASTDMSIGLVGPPTRVIIEDNDGAEVILVSTFVVVSEGNSGTADVEMCIALSLEFPTMLDRDVELLLNTVSTTATPGEDYEELVDVPLTIPAGSPSAFQVCQTVVIAGETIQENDEMFSVEVSVVNSLDDISAPSSFRVTIQDDGDVITECGNLADPANGDIAFNGSVSGRNAVGTIATYFCEEGADLVGEELRLCLPTGEWSGSAPACESIQFELSSYEVLEDIGADNLALRVCIDTTSLAIDRTVTVSTISGTATGGDDYVELSREVLLIAGTRRKCMGVVILDDLQQEASEYFEVVIEETGASTSVAILDDNDINECRTDPCDDNAVCTDTERSFTCSCNLGYVGDGFICEVIQFEESSYEVPEDVGADSLALRVCVNTSQLATDRVVRVLTISGTAIGGDDYVALDREVSLSVGMQRKCIGVVILDDSESDVGETFEVSIEKLGISTTVTIVDDESDTSFSFVDNTPAVIDDIVSFSITFGADVVTAMCALIRAGTIAGEVDCTSGMAVFTTLPSRISPFIPRITVTGGGQNETEVVTMETERQLRLGIGGRCSVHLINTGVSQARNDDGALVSTIEWGLAAPGDVDRSNIRFSCSLDSEDFSDCVSPYVSGTLPSGQHSLSVRVMANTPGCNRFVITTFMFHVPT